MDDEQVRISSLGKLLVARRVVECDHDSWARDGGKPGRHGEGVHLALQLVDPATVDLLGEVVDLLL